MPEELAHRFITSLVFTIAVETSVLFALLHYVFPKAAANARTILLAGAFASFATIPYVWFVFPAFFDTPRTSLWLSEPFAFLIEAVFYRYFLGVSWRTALTLSLIANVASYVLGPLLRGAGLWIYW